MTQTTHLFVIRGWGRAALLRHGGRLAEVRRRGLDEQRVAHVAHPGGAVAGPRGDGALQARLAEDLAAVAAVLLAARRRERRPARRALLRVLLVLPPHLRVRLADLLQLDLEMGKCRKKSRKLDTERRAKLPQTNFIMRDPCVNMFKDRLDRKLHKFNHYFYNAH